MAGTAKNKHLRNANKAKNFHSLPDHIKQILYLDAPDLIVELDTEPIFSIDVSFTDAIPSDYKGAMGVPISFLNKYNPDQFEIIGLGISNSGLEVGVQPYKPKHKKYLKSLKTKNYEKDIFNSSWAIINSKRICQSPTKNELPSRNSQQ